MMRVVALVERPMFRLFLVGLVALGLQTTVLNDLRPFGVILQIMLVLAASSGLARGSEIGAIAGFLVGFMYDLVLTTPLGLGATVFAIAGYLAGFANSFVHEPTWWSRMLLGGVASAVGTLLMPLALAMVGIEGALTTRVVVIVAVVAVSNAVLCVPFEKLCRWILKDPEVVPI